MTVRKGIPRLGKHRKEPDFGTKCPEVAGSVPTLEAEIFRDKDLKRCAVCGAALADCTLGTPHASRAVPPSRFRLKTCRRHIFYTPKPSKRESF